MEDQKSPRLRNVDKGAPPFLLNHFPDDFGLKLGKEIIYLLATKATPSLEGNEWEKIFSICINGIWKPSNIGLDDVTLENCAWGAKTVKAKNPSKQKQVRLISGRNSPVYSYGDNNYLNKSPEDVGSKVIEIWNSRVDSIRRYFRNLRTVVLMKSDNLNEVGVFEFETIRYDYNAYNWLWNKNNNLEGHLKINNKHTFTWQPHGSQFTIIENVPDEILIVELKTPKDLTVDPQIMKSVVFESINYDDSWVQVRKTKTNL